MMLDVKDLHVSYGAIKAVRGISFHVDKGEIVTLIGANGAGKTTTLRTISGLEKAKSGTITFNGKNITSMKSHDIAKLGITHVPEGRRIFTNLTVMDNLKMASNIRQDKATLEDAYEEVFELFPRLKERRTQSAITLSGGEQQMLAVGRAIVSNGELVVLDEPSMGLAPLVVEDIFSAIKKLNDNGTTILLNEQNAFMALSIADRAYVMETGEITIEGTGKELIEDERIKEAYLGA